MAVHLINPSDSSFGIAVITPRWLYVLAAATPAAFGDPIVHDETLQPLDEDSIAPGDIVGIGIHTGNAMRGYRLGQALRARGAWVVFGGIHATLYPEEAFEFQAADCVVQGDGDIAWAEVLHDRQAGVEKRIYDAGRAPADQFRSARWDLLPPNKYMWGSVQTVRGCPKHCSFCSVWRTDGQKPRQRNADAVIEEVVELRRRGFRFVALADDNFYPVTLTDIRNAERQGNAARVAELRSIRDERFELMERLSEMPADMTFFTQITMEAAEDPAFLDAMRKARIRGALVGVESVTPEGLKSVFKDFNDSGDDLIRRLRVFREHHVHVLASFIFGLPTDRPETFAATLDLAERANVTFAQFVMLTPFAGTVDFEKWVKSQPEPVREVDGVPITRYWLIPADRRPKMFVEHPAMSIDEIRNRTQGVWDAFYSLRTIWKRSSVAPTLRARLAFVFVSKLYRTMYAKTGIASDSARRGQAHRWASLLAVPTLKLFQGAPMPNLTVPARPAVASSGLVSIR